MAAKNASQAVLDSFTLFGTLPKEPRDEIWEHATQAIEGRLILIANSPTGKFWVPVCNDKSNSLPALLSACTDSRARALKILKPLRCSFDITNGVNPSDITGMYYNPETDTICVNVSYLDGFLMTFSQEKCSDVKLLLITELQTIIYKGGRKDYARGGVTGLISRLRNLASIKFVRERRCMRLREWDRVQDYLRVTREEEDEEVMERLLVYVRGAWKKKRGEGREEVEMVAKLGAVFSLGTLTRGDSNFAPEMLIAGGTLDSDSEEVDEEEDKEVEAAAEGRKELLKFCKNTRGLENVVLRWRVYGEEEHKGVAKKWEGSVQMGSLVSASGRSAYTDN